MASFRAIFIAGAMAIGAFNFAHAADLDLPPPPPVEAPPPAPVASGWYLRGDVGVGIAQLSQQDSVFADSIPAGFANNGSGVSDQITFGGGVGYQFNNWFRADVTGEYRTLSRYWGLESYSSVGSASPNCPVVCYDRYSGNVSNTVFLANGYFDIGTWYGVTPFVGAGIGGAYNYFSGLTDTGLENIGAAGYAPANGSFNLAWDVTAGISYALTQNLSLEFSYRYLDMGTVRSAPIACNSTCGASGAESENFHLHSNDVLLGLRYTFAELPPVAPPLVTKY
jgi:opacity protein-like surface antigen